MVTHVGMGGFWGLAEPAFQGPGTPAPPISGGRPVYAMWFDMTQRSVLLLSYERKK